jgi:hypothetical protein
MRSRSAPLDSTLQLRVRPCGSTATQSVKVPPVSIQICQVAGLTAQFR